MTPTSLREHLQAHRDLLNNAAIDGLRGEHALVLLLMSDHPQTAKEIRLTAYFGINSTFLLKRLSARGLILIHPNPHDGRSVLVSKTKAGQHIADKLRAKLFHSNRTVAA